MAVAVATEDVPEAQRVLLEYGQSPEERAVAYHVIDHDSGEDLSCPACGEASPSGSEHCTECGLRIG